MASLLTNVRRAVRRQTPITIRKEYDRVSWQDTFVVRGPTERRPLERLGEAASPDERDQVLSLCREAGYNVDEIVPDKSWICRP